MRSREIKREVKRDALEIDVSGLPRAGGLFVGTAKLVELSLRDEGLLLLGARSETPTSGIGVAFHDDALDLGNDAVIAGGKLRDAHLGDTDGNGLSLGGHEDDLLVDGDVGVVAQKTGDHELGAVADGVDGAILDDNPLKAGQEHLERFDDASEIGLCVWCVGLEEKGESAF